MQVSMRVEGLSELNRSLELLPAKIENNIMKGALRAGATVIANEARARVPVKTGQLKAGIHVMVDRIDGKIVALVRTGSSSTVYAIGKKGKKTDAASKVVSASGKTHYYSAYYANWVEFGTSKMAARPFMRPAFSTKVGAALEVIRGYIAKRVVIELAKRG